MTQSCQGVPQGVRRPWHRRFNDTDSISESVALTRKVA